MKPPETTPSAPCFFKAWAGYPLPTDKEILQKELELLSGPCHTPPPWVYGEYRNGAREAVRNALEALKA